MPNMSEIKAHKPARPRRVGAYPRRNVSSPSSTSHLETKNDLAYGQGSATSVMDPFSRPDPNQFSSDDELDAIQSPVEGDDDREVVAFPDPYQIEAKNTESVQEEESDEEESKYAFRSRNRIDIVSRGHPATDVYCTRYSPDSRFLAAGCGDGSVRIFNPTGKMAYALQIPTFEGMPTTCIRFRPLSSSAKTKNVLICANANGSLTHWHMMSQTCLYSITEEDNQLYCCDYRNDGEQFATAGLDTKVRVYEESTKSLLMTLTTGATKGSIGHSNRVYCVKYSPSDPNIIVSGGWDNTIQASLCALLYLGFLLRISCLVDKIYSILLRPESMRQVWDTRIGTSIRSWYGPHICGDAIDMDDQGHVLTASWRPDDALQLWDFKSGRLIDTFPWMPYGRDKLPEQLYTCQFSPDYKSISAGGTGTNDAKLFDVATRKITNIVNMGNTGCYSVSFAPNGSRLAIAGGSTQMTELDL